MGAIRIHRCRLRLVRHGGWSWGPDPRALLQAAIRALPALLAAALEGLWPEEDEREIAVPVRLRLAVRQGELMAAHVGFSGEGLPPVSSPGAEIARRLAESLKEVLAGELPEEGESREEPASDLPESPEAPGWIALPDSRGRDALLPADVSLWRLLREWRDRGDLALRLELLSEAALEAWVAGLLREGAGFESRDSEPVSLPEFQPRTAAALERPGHPGEPALKSRATNEGLWRDLDTADPGGITVGSPGFKPRAAETLRAWLMRVAETADPRGTADRRSTVPVRHSVRSMPRRDGDVQGASALPFLMLGPLSRTGYLKTLATTFAAAGFLDDLSLFAAALAFKALPPPERGWRRTPTALETAAACAGLLDAVSGEDLTRLSRRASACLEPLAADLTASLLAGHEPGRPLFLAAAGDGLLLAEVDGVFPIACASGFAELSPVLARLRDETLLVPAGIATPALLREIDASGARFLTAAPPTRSEPWRPLRLPGRPGGDRIWTNDPAKPGLARQAAGLAVAEEGARRLWNALGVERPILPSAADPALDRHLTLAAGVALGTLAWALWREREPVDPVLALERFGDLEARVRFRADSVQVLIPLGRRHRDLFDHRLLDPVRDAVWLGGRVLEFGGG